MEHQIELVVGLILLIVGLSVIFRGKDWKDFIEWGEEKGNPFVIGLGILDLLFGSVIIAYHWVWYNMAILTTFFGVIMFIRGIVRLLFPNIVLGKLQNAKTSLLSLGIISVLISFLILYGVYINLKCPEFYCSQVKISIYE